MPNPKTPDKPTEPAGKPQAAPAAKQATERKRWVKKTPLDIVAEQAEKLREEVDTLEEEIKQKRAQLQKFEEFRKSVQTS